MLTKLKRKQKVGKKREPTAEKPKYRKGSHMDDKHQEALGILKEALTTASVLCY